MTKTPEKTRILLAEDDSITRLRVESYLRKWGFEPVSVADGQAAWDALNSDNAPRLAILDWQMPKMTGIDVCKLVRAADWPHYTYLLMLTAREQISDRVEGFSAGADDYVAKPFKLPELQARLRPALRVLELHDQLRNLNAHLEDKVLQRTQQIQELLEQKDRFIHQLGHDLRTPLTPLVSLLPKVLESQTDPQVRKMLKISTDSARHIKGLVEKTLHLAKLNSTQFLPHITDVNLWGIAESALDVLRCAEPPSPHRLINRIDKDHQIAADPILLRELLDNLISNAAKFTPPDGAISVAASQDNQWVNISISDTGIGMTEEQISLAFDEFYKADESRHDLKSSGLGLSICRRIVAMIQGQIAIESAGMDHGTTIRVKLPSTV